LKAVLGTAGFCTYPRCQQHRSTAIDIVKALSRLAQHEADAIKENRDREPR